MSQALAIAHAAAVVVMVVVVVVESATTGRLAMALYTMLIIGLVHSVVAIGVFSRLLFRVAVHALAFLAGLTGAFFVPIDSPRGG